MADNNNAGSSTAIVAIVAIIIILGVAYYLFQGMGAADTGNDIEIDVPAPEVPVGNE